LEDNGRSKESYIEEIAMLNARLAAISALEPRYKSMEDELKRTKEELEIQQWGMSKTNESIKALYKELERKNEALRGLDRLKTDFINTVSHELRTPLTVIQEAVCQVLDGVLGDINLRQREFLELCLEDVERLRRIVDDLLDASKIEAGKFSLVREELDVVDVAKRVITSLEPVAKRNALPLRAQFPDETAVAYIDRDTIIRVFTNLIGNALKFTSQGHITITIVEKPTCIECAVIDTGRGISDEDLPNVFNKFQQFGRQHGSGQKGTGLGLNICKSIVEMHQGKIWVESILHKGTQFHFTLPKYNAVQLYKEYVIGGIRDAIAGKRDFSVMIFGIHDLSAGHGEIREESVGMIMRSLQQCMQQGLSGIDVVIKGMRTIMIVLPGTERSKAHGVAEWIRKKITGILVKEKADIGNAVFFEVVNYPADGKTEEELRACLSAYAIAQS